MRARFLLLLAAAALSFYGRAAEIHVAAAASLTDVLQELAPLYRAERGHSVVFNFGASSLLARQIREGAPADVFLSADEEKMDQLARDRHIDDATRVRMLSNTLVVVVAEESRLRMTAPRDLLQVRTLALAEPSTVPAGIYGRQWLQQQQLWDALASRVIPTDNVRAALAAVEAGNVDAAIVYRTDARIAKRVRVGWEVPPSEVQQISYPFAVTRDAAQPAAARDFVRWLQSSRARQIFAKHGFIVR